jgi:mannosyltransferase
LPAILIVTGIACFSLVIDFMWIEARSLWLDETFSATLAQLSWPQMWHVISADEANSLLYHLVLHFWTWLGSDEFVLRSLSALAVSASVLPLFGVMRLLYDRTHGYVACLLLASNAFVVQFAQEARGYALELLLVTTASYLFVRSVRKQGWTTWALYALIAALGVYTHLYAALVLLAHFVTLPLWKLKRRSTILLLSSYGVIALLLIPLFLLLRSQGAGNIDFLEPPSLRALIGLFGELTGYGGPPLTVLYFLTCCAAFVGARWLRSNDQPGLWIGWIARASDAQGLSFLVAWLFVPILASVLISVVLPIYQPRYLIVVAPPLACIAAAGLIRAWRPLSVLMMVGLLALSTRGLHLLYRGHLYTEDWRGASRYVLSGSKPTDGIVFEAPWVRIPFEYYAKLYGFHPSIPHPIFPSPNWGRLSVISRQFDVTAKHWLRKQPADADRVWVVLAHEFAYGPRAHLLPARFMQEYDLMSQQLFASISVSLYERD